LFILAAGLGFIAFIAWSIFGMFLPVVVAGIVAILGGAVLFVGGSLGFIFFGPFILVLLGFMVIFYWAILFPVGIAGGLFLMFSNVTCTMAVDPQQCEADKLAEADKA